MRYNAVFDEGVEAVEICVLKFDSPPFQVI